MERIIMGYIQIHFDGDIATNHQVSMRTLGKTLTHLQRSLDRAYLEQKNGSLWKNSRMKAEDYELLEILVEAPKEGGYILDFFTGPLIKPVIDRVMKALDDAVEESKNLGEHEAVTIEQSIEQKQVQIALGLVTPASIENTLNNPDKNIVRKYADRAIVREFDGILSIIRSQASGDSTFEIILNGNSSSTFSFTKDSATNFHQAISKRDLGDPILYSSIINSLDRKNLSGQIVITTGKVSNIYFSNEFEFQKVIKFFEKKEKMKFAGSPYLEYGSYDPVAGDIYFIDLV
jgi:hypothetical protein